MAEGVSGARQRRVVLVDAMRSRLWPVPAVGVVLAVVLGVVLPDLDEALDEHLPPHWPAISSAGAPTAPARSSPPSRHR